MSAIVDGESLLTSHRRELSVRVAPPPSGPEKPGPFPVRHDLCSTGGVVMDAKTHGESFKAEGEAAVEKLKALIHEGNVRRISRQMSCARQTR